MIVNSLSRKRGVVLSAGDVLLTHNGGMLGWAIRQKARSSALDNACFYFLVSFSPILLGCKLVVKETGVSYGRLAV